MLTEATETIAPQADLPKTCLPTWGVADLPEPKPISWRNWTSFIGPGIVMMGIQIGGGEWLLGPEITARYGGGLMWIATIAIVLQVFYNIECGRYALYCGEPVITGFMRTRPGPAFWIGTILVLNFGADSGLVDQRGARLSPRCGSDAPPVPKMPGWSRCWPMSAWARSCCRCW